MIINIEKTIELNNNDRQEAMKILTMIDNGYLEEIKSRFLNANEKNDIEELRAICHQLSGTLSYVALPNLEKSVKKLHDSLKITPEDQTGLSQEVSQLIIEIDAFSPALKKIHNK